MRDNEAASWESANYTKGSDPFCAGVHSNLIP
jgi:hypothetical protein